MSIISKDNEIIEEKMKNITNIDYFLSDLKIYYDSHKEIWKCDLCGDEDEKEIKNNFNNNIIEKHNNWFGGSIRINIEKYKNSFDKDKNIPIIDGRNLVIPPIFCPKCKIKMLNALEFDRKLDNE